MNPPLVSVIVPCYNMAAFLEETLRSIVASDYPSVEVIVVDDGSTDDSRVVAEAFIRSHPADTIVLLTQPNKGVSASRNNAIRHAHGQYILPVDADNLISNDFIRLAVEVLEAHPEVLVVGSEAEFIGARTGRWSFPPFSRALLARKNIIDACAMYRRADWERTPGYNEQFPIREDWDFWLSIFSLDGDFYRIPKTCLYYRIHPQSKRTQDRRQKRRLVDEINRRHPEFLRRYLGGPLHYHRSWSRLLNRFRSERVIGRFQDWDSGMVIHSDRNTLRAHNGLIIKQFGTPGLVKALLYGLFVKSKARRSYEYAERLLARGVRTPVAYKEVRVCGLLRESYYVCAQSRCTHTFNDLITQPDNTEALTAIGCFTAAMHEAGALHRDFSGGNILFDDDGRVEIIDLNRIRWCRHIDLQTGCKNFERLNIRREALTVMATAYAEARGFDADECVRYVLSHRWKKHVRQGITNL